MLEWRSHLGGLSVSSQLSLTGILPRGARAEVSSWLAVTQVCYLGAFVTFSMPGFQALLGMFLGPGQKSSHGFFFGFKRNG